MTETAVAPTEPVRETPSSRIPNLLAAAGSIGLSPATYYALAAFGYTDYTALLCSTLVSGAWVAGLAAARRRIDGLAAFAFALSLFGLALAPLDGDGRMMLLKDPLSSGVISVLLLVSCRFGRPAMFGLAQRLHAPGAAAQWDTLWHNDSDVRRVFRRSTAVWGAGLALDAALRTVLILGLPIPAAVALMNPVQWAIIAALAVYTVRTRRRLDMKSRLAQLSACPLHLSPCARLRGSIPDLGQGRPRDGHGERDDDREPE